jgi:hypothetical protein
MKNGKPKETKKKMILVKSEKIKKNKWNICKGMHKYTKGGNTYITKVSKYVRDSTQSMEHKGERKKYTKPYGKGSMWKKTRKIVYKIQSASMSVNEYEYKLNREEKMKNDKKKKTIPLGMGPHTNMKSTDRTRDKCTVHSITRRDSVWGGPLKREKSLCVVYRVIYIRKRYKIQGGKRKNVMIIDRYKMSTEPMDIPDGGGGNGGKGDGVKGKKSVKCLYESLINVKVVTSKHMWRYSRVTLIYPSNKNKICKRSGYEVAVSYNRYGE